MICRWCDWAVLSHLPLLSVHLCVALLLASGLIVAVVLVLVAQLGIFHIMLSTYLSSPSHDLVKCTYHPFFSTPPSRSPSLHTCVQACRPPIADQALVSLPLTRQWWRASRPTSTWCGSSASSGNERRHGPTTSRWAPPPITPLGVLIRIPFPH